MLARLVACLVCVQATCAPGLSAQLPDFYKSVDRVVWVVEDLNQITQGWRKMGLTGTEDHRELEWTDVRFRGRMTTVRVLAASARFANATVHWLQPLDGQNPLTEFLAKHRSGVFSLMHRTPTLEALQRETKRLRGLGVDVLQEGAVEDDAGPAHYVFLDTEPQGKYVLGLLHSPEGENPEALAPSKFKFVQWAFAVRDLEPVAQFWNKLGLPEFSYTHPKLRNRVYRGEPGRFDARFGWQRHEKSPMSGSCLCRAPACRKITCRTTGKACTTWLST